MKQEAVFMRIITLVTLFFLPGTFVSVSYPKSLGVAMTNNPLQTVMSTDIVHWQTSDPGPLEKVVASGAIWIFLAVTIPFMVLTFAAAYVFYRWNKRQEQNETDRQAADESQP